jgi:hypothetical protein
MPPMTGSASEQAENSSKSVSSSPKGVSRCGSLLLEEPAQEHLLGRYQAAQECSGDCRRRHQPRARVGATHLRRGPESAPWVERAGVQT